MALYSAERLYENGPVRFTFGNPPKLVMEFTAIPKETVEDITLKYDPCHIQLYTYDWIISNYSMLKSVSEAITSPTLRVGPCENMDLKLILTRNGDNLKIEAYLLKETKLSEEEKARDANCPLISKATLKNILHLEFLDSAGKTIDYYMNVPYEFRYMNTSKLYAWLKEENVSRFVSDDKLSIRAKVSMRYYPDADDDEETLEERSTKVLMKDMKGLFNDRRRFPDLVIKVGGQFILAHKSIVYTQCPNFAEMAKSDEIKEQGIAALQLPNNLKEILKEDCETICIPNENADVFLSVLHFIYCRKLQATEAVNDFAVYELAKKYGVRELSMLLMPREIEVRSEVKVEKLSFTWYVKNFSSLCKAGFSPIQCPNFKTEIEADITWSVVIFCLDSQNIILNLQRNSGFNLNVQTSFKLGVCKADGTLHDFREFKHLFTSGTITNCHPGFMNSVSRFLITPDLLFNDTLTVYCDLVVSSGAMVSELKQTYPGENPKIDPSLWVDNFRALYRSEEFSDAALIVDDKEFKIHKAILSARSEVFARMFESDMEEKRSGCARIEDISSDVMQRALLYIYTGEIVDMTMAHAPELYRTADKYEILDLKTRCSEFIMQNMDADSAAEILILADLYGDEKMKKAAKNMICRNASQALLSPRGIDLITNHHLLAHDILESLSVVYCSLPPQDAFDKPTGAVPNTAKAGNSSTESRTYVRATRGASASPNQPGRSFIEAMKSVSLNN